MHATYERMETGVEIVEYAEAGMTEARWKGWGIVEYAEEEGAKDWCDTVGGVAGYCGADGRPQSPNPFSSEKVCRGEHIQNR